MLLYINSTNFSKSFKLLFISDISTYDKAPPNESFWNSFSKLNLFNTSILFNHAFLIYRLHTFAVDLLAVAAAAVMGISLFQG